MLDAVDRHDLAPAAQPLLTDRPVSRQRVAIGMFGEEIACRELERLGYAILARRSRRRGGEIDIVARDGSTVAFVEVKCRESGEFGEPAEAVTWGKRRRLVQLAFDYLMRHRLGECACRFDVVAILLDEEGPRVTVLRNAFSCSD